MEENPGREFSCDFGGTKLALPNVVLSSLTNGKEDIMFPEERRELEKLDEQIDYRKFDCYSINSMPLLDISLEKQGFSKGAIRW